MAITEPVFTEPYFEAEMNHHTAGLDPIVKILRSDVKMKSEAQNANEVHIKYRDPVSW